MNTEGGSEGGNNNFTTIHDEPLTTNSNEPRWLQYLTNRLRWREAIYNNVGHEIFENPANKQSCCICLGKYKIGEDIGKLNCGHRFHWYCILKWLIVRNVCPLCNRRGLYFE
ncbi:unnamed protein product [Lathyrus oleraceus]|uniref:RING-type E3 ubiquitin transferase n=1 Tax=Pisum sativum TaxID=3888 RepID=A0A9D5B634_PEA|nr:probable E3 ubiquitin-protein ligase RHG1A [Pisum sativum]KAI5435398.1 hypothetical protein KIW84_021998 [Pisum sativum]